MKAFKGCTNEVCKACVKKIHYKKEDEYCLKCGQQLSFVCADCWKVMEDDKHRLCISCKARKEQKREENWDKAKKQGGAVVASVGAVAVAIKTVSKDAKVIKNGAKDLGKMAVDVVKVFKK